VAELEQQARERLRQRLERLVQADLQALGVRPSDLPALPRLRERFTAVRRAFEADDLGKSVEAIAGFRRALAGRRMSCKRLRRKKYGWSRARLKELRRAAPRQRDERKAFLKKHDYRGLRDRLREMRKRAGDDKLTCAEKSLAYEQLIPDIVRALQNAGLREKQDKKQDKTRGKKAAKKEEQGTAPRDRERGRERDRERDRKRDR
jgi:hypothetical protein